MVDGETGLALGRLSVQKKRLLRASGWSERPLVSSCSSGYSLQIDFAKISLLSGLLKAYREGVEGGKVSNNNTCIS